MITGAGLAAGAVIGLSSSAQAAATYYYVGNTGGTGTAATDCDDPGNTDCTLADAIDVANSNSGFADTIYFSSTISGQPIVLTNDLPTIDDAVYIVGNGAGQTVISGDDSYRIFNLNMTTPGDAVGLYALTLTDGSATYGAAVNNDNARLRLVFSVLSGNNATGRGGAVYEPGNYDNGADDRFFYDTFSDNHANYGGAIAADVSWGAVLGATFAANSADAGGGGAVYANGGYGYIVDSTISGNQATAAGGGVSAGSIGLNGTILANNTGSANPDLDVPSGTAGYDLVADPGDTGIGVVPTIITGQDPQLGTLGVNGGYNVLPTLKPASSSPVVDQSYSYAYYDERGLDRTIDNPNRANVAGGNGADIGAVELSLAEGPQATPSQPTGPPALPPVVHKKKCKKKKRTRSAESAKKKKCKKKRKTRSARPGARAIRAWDARAAAHPLEHHWGDHAWSVGR